MKITNETNSETNPIEFPINDLVSVIDFMEYEGMEYICHIDYEIQGDDGEFFQNPENYREESDEEYEERLLAVARSRNNHIYCSVARLKFWLKNQTTEKVKAQAT